MKMKSAKVQSKVPKGDYEGFSLNLKKLKNLKENAYPAFSKF
jgi:hypothetical protein